MVRRAPLWPCLRDAFAFLPRAWAGAWGVLVAFAVVLGLAIVPLHGRPAFPSALVTFAWLSVVVLVKVAAYGALLRLAIFGREARKEGLGIGGLQFGRPELRMLGGSALVFLFLTIVAVGLLVAVALITAAAAGGEDGTPSGPAAWVARGVQIGAALILFVLYVRLALFAPATIGRRRVVSLDALALAQGSFWTLLIGLALCLAPTALAVSALSRLPHGGPDEAMLAAGALVALLVFVQVPLVAGFLGAAYKRLEYIET